MTGYVYTIAGGKGGVGKTTTAINLAVALQEAGHDVVVVDADLGMANLGAMLEVEHEPSLHQVLAGEAAVSDAITEGPGGITVVPGERSLEAFADADPAELRTVLKALSTAYEVVLVDTGAGLSHETTVPLGLSDGVLLVTTADGVAVGDTAKTAQLADRIDGDVVGAVLTRADDDTDGSAVADRLGLELLAVVPEDRDATRDEPLVVSHADSEAAEAYRRLASTLTEVHGRSAGEETTPDQDGADEQQGEEDEADAGAEPGVPEGEEGEAETGTESESEAEPGAEGEEDAEGEDDEEGSSGVFGLFS